MGSPRRNIAARPDRSPRERQDRRLREGGRARPRRVHGRRPDGIVDLAEAIRDVRASGKPVLAYATGYTDDSYQLRFRSASEVWLNPLGVVGLAGPGGSRPLSRPPRENGRDSARLSRRHLAAVEPFTRDDMSPEAEQNAQALANALLETWRKASPRAGPRLRSNPTCAT